MATAYDTWKTDAPYDAEGEWVAERRDKLVAERRKMVEYVRDALDDALMADGDDYFATKLAEFFIAREAGLRRKGEDGVLAELLAATNLNKAIEHLITERLERDAETDAQHEWSTRQTGPDDH